MFVCYTLSMRGGKQSGYTLVEVVITLAVFALVSSGAYQAFNSMSHALNLSRLNTNIIALAEEQYEIVRNLAYEDVGTTTGSPSGVLLQDQTLTRDGTDFQVRIIVRNVDDAFDGTIGGTPNDVSPADYKLVELRVGCDTCQENTFFTTSVAPLSLESTSTNGSLFVHVFDANGQPIEGASVHVENNQVSPALVIDEETNVSGEVQLVDITPGVEAYEIQVSKSGYSSARTYTVGDPANPNPTLPHATVAAQALTEISFAIDLLSTVNVSSVTSTCAPVPDIDFLMQGTKLIGVLPGIYVYSEQLTTDASGLLSIPGVEWDTYTISLEDTIYDLAGTIPAMPLSLSPGTTQDVYTVVVPQLPNSLLFRVKDSGTELPVSDASVRLEAAGYDSTLLTGQGYFRQTDWSGGSGQADFTNETQFFSTDGNIDISNPAGELRLAQILGLYLPLGELTSSRFDTGSASNFYQIQWLPEDQPAEVGSDSIRFQIATNDDNATWDYVGPDGTNLTYYTLSDTNINSIHNGDRYIRYRVWLQTIDPLFTPNLAEVAITYSSDCVPPGQALFRELDPTTYTYTVTATGYQSATDVIDVSQTWQAQDILLSPN